MEEKRESFGSRLGFILVSAGCAIGIGNVWKFPYLCGQYGGAAFILIYLVFLLILGIPVMICEFAIGRSARRSAAKAFEVLEPKGTKWHVLKYISIFGCYLLMMYYTTVCGWMLDYFVKFLQGKFTGASSDEISAAFSSMLSSAPEMILWMVVTCLIGFVICYFGVQKGVERISKYMMSALLILMVVLAVHSVFLKGAGRGIAFYLVPDFETIRAKGFGNVVFAAMSQSFFTLSIGIGAMLIFGSYFGKDRSLSGEACTVTALDTFVALMAGFIVIPSCFAYGIEPNAGPKLIFITIPNIFANMPGGRIWGALFFVFLSFAALSTVVAVFENIIAFDMDLFGWTRKKSVRISAVLVILLSMPCVLGCNVWSAFQPLGEGRQILDLEDFIVSNNLLPLGSLAFVLFCTRKNGWGWKNFIGEADQGRGMRFPSHLRWYVSYVLPLIIIVIYLKGYYDFFSPQGKVVLALWMCLALLFLFFVLFCSFYTPKKKAASD